MPQESKYQNFNSTSKRSALVAELINSKPPIFIRYGILILFSIVLILTISCWFIQYPEIVMAEAHLIGTNAPKEVISHTDGKLLKIFFKENQNVYKGDILGYMESIANPESVLSISNDVDTMIDYIIKNKNDELINYYPNTKKHVVRKDLGELQTQNQIFVQSFSAFKDYLIDGFYKKKVEMLKSEKNNINKLREILLIQRNLLEQDLELTNQNFKSVDYLSKEKIFSESDFRDQKSKLIAKQLTIPQINALLIANELEQNEKLKEISNLENQFILQKSYFLQALLTFKSQIENWKYKYLLLAPVNGKILLTSFHQENQEIKSGNSLFFIQPPNASYFVELQIPQNNFGKVKKGQDVLLKFQAYPFEQYGSVLGKIDYINQIPSDSGYLAKVILPNGFVSIYKKPLKFYNNLNGKAEIITENMKLLERFYNSISKQINGR
jgi:HlyD family secretion protein